ncbi:hypothetical protein F1880_009575 [Penicillium rolfsii]|nr:hypothetical protein F1880_009575 [Penicillium rolfsii]
MATFKPLIPPHILRDDQNRNSPMPFPGKRLSISAAIRDNMTLSSWLLIGGLLQGVSLLALGPITILPTALILTYRVVDNLLMSFGITRNRYLDDVIHTKFSPQIPHKDGSFGSEPSRDQVVVLHLGNRSNHPLGLLAPGMKGIGESYMAMVKDMEADPEKSGLLGTSRWIKQDDAAGNEAITIFYLRDYESLHRFAYGEVHMNGVRYWNSIARKYPHISIYHETYVVPRGHWEAIYINSKPTGLADTWFQFQDKEDGARGLVRPIVDARTGILKSKTGRLSMANMEKVKEYDEVYGDAYRG